VLQHPSSYRECSCAKKELQRRKFHYTSTQALSGFSFAGFITPSRPYTAAEANRVEESIINGNHRQVRTTEEAPEKCTKEDAVKLITTVQQIMV
jgi:hypothetical protein